MNCTNKDAREKYNNTFRNARTGQQLAGLLVWLAVPLTLCHCFARSQRSIAVCVRLNLDKNSDIPGKKKKESLLLSARFDVNFVLDMRQKGQVPFR